MLQGMRIPVLRNYKYLPILGERKTYFRLQNQAQGTPIRVSNLPLFAEPVRSQGEAKAQIQDFLDPKPMSRQFSTFSSLKSW